MRDLIGAVKGGGTKFLCAVGHGPDQILNEVRIPTGAPDATLAAVAAFFRPYCDRLRAVGVCAFGPLELNPAAGDAYGSLLASPKLAWSHVGLRATLAQALQVPILIETDVNGAALAEQRWGRGQGADPFVYVTVGTGVGVGVVIDGHPLHGLLHPELGHMRVPRLGGDAFGGLCPFHTDCLEGMASAPAIHARTGSEPDALDDAHPVWEVEAHYLATLVHTLVLAYSPQRIVLSGGVMQRSVLWPKLHAASLASLAGYIPRVQCTPVGVADFVVPSGLSGRAGLSGGFALVHAQLATTL